MRLPCPCNECSRVKKVCCVITCLHTPQVEFAGVSCQEPQAQWACAACVYVCWTLFAETAWLACKIQLLFTWGTMLSVVLANKRATSLQHCSKMCAAEKNMYWMVTAQMRQPGLVPFIALCNCSNTCLLTSSEQAWGRSKHNLNVGYQASAAVTNGFRP